MMLSRGSDGARTPAGATIRTGLSGLLHLDTSRGISSRAPEIDGLRAVAVVAVFCFHAYPSTLFPLWTGVDLFFVLSGFLITNILMRHRPGDRRFLPNFYARRALRIWPIYYLLLVALVAYAALDNRDLSLRDVLASGVFLQFTDLYGGYRNTADVVAGYVPYFSHSWSVAVEEQFYVLWPPVVVLLGRTRRFPMLCLTLVGMGIALRAAHLAPYLLATRVDGLALGAALSWWCGGRVSGPADPDGRRRLAQMAAIALGVGTLVVGWYLIGGYVGSDRRTPVTNELGPLVPAGFALAFVGLLGLLVSGRLGQLRRLLATPILVYLGGISYAIYLFHTVVFHMVWTGSNRVASLPYFAVVSVSFVATVAAAHLSMRFIEGPILRLKSRFPVDQPTSRPTSSVVVPSRGTS